MMNVILQRISDDGSITKGTLTAGVFSCDTLELPWRGNATNLSCIPAGTYNCLWEYQNDLTEYHYQLQAVLGRTGVFIHQGNEEKDTEGCVLVGDSYNGDEILNSLVTLIKFEDLMNKQPFTLTIVNGSAIGINNNNQNNNMNVQKIARVLSVVTTVNYSTMEVDENALLVDGNMPPLEGTLGLNETVTYPNTMTMEAIVADVQSKVGPDFPVSPAFGLK